jgi:hypothetical protein
MDLQVSLSPTQSTSKKPCKLSPFGDYWYLMPDVSVPLIYRSTLSNFEYVIGLDLLDIVLNYSQHKHNHA